MRHLFIGHQFGLNQLILICTDKGQDGFLITDCLAFPCLSAPHFLPVFITFPLCHLTLLHITYFMDIYGLISLHVQTAWVVSNIW